MENAQSLMFLHFLKDLKEQKLLMLLQTLRLLKEQKEQKELAEFKQKIFDLYAKGHRDSSLPSNTRTWDRPSLLWERLGNFIGNVFAGAIDFNTDTCVPSIIFKINEINSIWCAELLDVTLEREGIDISEANGKYVDGREFGVIGYDTEFLSEEKKMLSHQFCFDCGLGKRFAVVLDTGIRLTDSNFLRFLQSVIEVIPGKVEEQGEPQRKVTANGRRVKIKEKSTYIRDWAVFAQFSLVEGSWLDSSGLSIIERQKKEWKGRVSLSNPNVLTHGKGAEKGKKKGPKITLRFGDTMNLDPRSLKAAAEGCGLEKYGVLPLKYQDKNWFREKCDQVYKRLDVFQRKRPAEFYRYGARDAIITSGIPIVLHSKFGVDNPFQLRTAMYSEKHIYKWFGDNFNGIRDGWQRILGQIEIKYQPKEKKKTNEQPEDVDKEQPDNKMVADESIEQEKPKKVPKPKSFWRPSKLQQHILKDWYKGGRNEARQVGCFEGQVSYFDMTSAYPTALAALRGDYDFGDPIIRTRNDGAEERIEQLMPYGPFQPHGIHAYVRFTDDCKVPMAPISTEAGIIYPMETEGQIICWPEYWVAKELKKIEEEFILSFYEFPLLETRLFPDYVLELLKNRQKDKVFYKSILNYMSGKFAQGRREGVPYSSISCPALAAYLTSVTRAAAAEIGNLSEYYAITTDGIISPQEELTPGPVNRLLAERLEPIHFKWMKTEFVADQAVIWKTRGYILVNSQADKDAPAEKRFKQARMGLQGEEPVEIVEQVLTGKGIRKSAVTFANLDDGEIFSFVEKEFDVNPNYDFKYSIEPDTIEERTITIAGKELTMPCFQTKPLRNIIEHLELREISDRWARRNLRKRVTSEGTEKGGTKTLDSNSLKRLTLFALLNDGRCRHMQWEFRKRLMQIVEPEEIDLHIHSYNAVKKKPLYKIPAIYGDIREFLPILEREVWVVRDKKRQPELLEQIIVQMENYRGGYVDVGEQITEE
jgi:hypothetical protein